MEALLIGFMNILCFLVGAKVGQKVSKGEDIQVNPVEAYRQHEARKTAQAEQDRFAAIMENIERYDGTASGQKDVPGR